RPGRARAARRRPPHLRRPPRVGIRSVRPAPAPRLARRARAARPRRPPPPPADGPRRSPSRPYPSVTTPHQYCQEKAAASGSSFYYSFLFLPPPRRAAITALYAFCREVDDVVDECTDPGVARTKLAWWRDELDRM